MYPILLQFQGFIVTTFGLFLTLSFLAFVVALMKTTLLRKVSIGFFSRHVLVLFLATILGAKGLYWVHKIIIWILQPGDYYNDISSNLDYGRYLTVLKQFINVEEFYVIGGVLAFGLLFFFYAKREKEHVLEWLDALLPPFALALAVGFIGSLLGGYYVGSEIYGFPGISYAAVDFRYSYAAQIASSVLVHPIALYASITCFLIAFISYTMLKKVTTSGVVGIVTLILICLQNIIIEFFRNPVDNTIFLGPLTINQIVSMLGILVAIYIFMKKLPRVHG
ncbi:hypothetical protein COW46_03085 [Candidatus Gracilibacteria bacterium CG17_big_fil_post_rev_8_21_14_2_50_48_13]|nr:MAG: hypothetical protein COW46_03085 [Candidatus Gracilibacteria bacterium CG17_big_fil_post_rev_8_21_14_2_50_48_13]